MKVIITGDGAKEAVRDAIRELLPWVEARAKVVGVDLEGVMDLNSVAADLVIAFGGDGFLLGVARRLEGEPVPVASVNFGKLGFLAGFDHGSVRETLGEVFEGRMNISPRKMMEIRRSGAAVPHFALNDAVISRGNNPKIIRIDMTLSPTEALSYAGDGLIVSTPTGSTAYSLSAGGPIMMPGTRGLILTPICPQAFGARPLLLPDEARIRIALFPGPDGAILAVDGGETVDLESGDWLEVGMCEREFLLVSDPARSFMGILREKLNWGDLHLNNV